MSSVIGSRALVVPAASVSESVGLQTRLIRHPAASAWRGRV